ncbi:DUF1015 domain-containing protein [bacterium]|nr:DUF1015 domain-containing protein [bacterium]
MEIKPFRALLPAPENAAEVTCYPHLAYDQASFKKLLQSRPNSLLHIVRAEFELAGPVAYLDPRIYERVRTNFHNALEKNIFQLESTPGYFIHELEILGHKQVGLTGLVKLEEHRNGTIKGHEKTFPEQVLDRQKRIAAFGGHVSPLFLLAKENPNLEHLLATETSVSPCYSFDTMGQVHNRLWRVSQTNKVQEIFSKIPDLYIADGHHRIEAAEGLCNELCELGELSRAESFIPVTIFPEKAAHILAYNRALKVRPGKWNRLEFMKNLQTNFEVLPASNGLATTKGEIRLYLDKQWLNLKSTIPKQGDPLSDLDLSIASEKIIKPLVEDYAPAHIHGMHYVPAINGITELESLVNSGNADFALSFFPVSAREIIAISDRGQTMVPKATWFDPKLCHGLTIYRFQDQDHL